MCNLLTARPTACRMYRPLAWTFRHFRAQSGPTGGWPASRNALRMLHPVTLRDLLDRGVAVRASEAVAIVQRLMHDVTCATDAATGPYGPLALHNVEIGGDGNVRSVETAATPSVYEAAALLQELLDASPGSVPGALRYTVGRALLEVDAPPFDSRQQFGAALERFEQGTRANAIAALHVRGTAPETHADRRRATSTHAALRRELRDTDLQLYAATAAPRPIVRQDHVRTSAGPIAGCMLAGAVLIVAGSATSAVRLASPAEFAPTTSERRGNASDIALPAQQAAAEPVAEPVVAVRTPTRAVSPRRHVTAQRAASARTKRPTRAEGARARRSADEDRGVIARIRFEWDNPFR